MSREPSPELRERIENTIRFLSEIRTDCVTVGVCFAEQIVDELPVEAHDVTMSASG